VARGSTAQLHELFVTRTLVERPRRPNSVTGKIQCKSELQAQFSRCSVAHITDVEGPIAAKMAVQIPDDLVQMSCLTCMWHNLVGVRCKRFETSCLTPGWPSGGSSLDGPSAVSEPQSPLGRPKGLLS